MQTSFFFSRCFQTRVRVRYSDAFTIHCTALDRNICALSHEISVLSALWLTPRNQAFVQCKRGRFLLQHVHRNMAGHGGSEQVLGFCEDHGCGHMPVTGPPLREKSKPHRGVCDGRDVYFFKSSYREAVNKARDLGRSDRGIPLLLHLDPIPHEHLFSLHFVFFLDLSLFISSPQRNTLQHLFTSVMNGEKAEPGSHIQGLFSFILGWKSHLCVWWDALMGL